MIEAILFDFDGVIIDSEPLHFRSFNKILTQFKLQIDYPTYLKKYAGLASSKLLPKLLIDHGLDISKIDLDRLVAKKVRIYKKLLEAEEINTIPGLLSFLKAAAKSINKLAICSSAALSEVMAALDKLEQGQLKPYFTCIISAEDISHPKPAPDSYLKAAACLKALPQHCLAIEDTPHGIKAAKSAGMYVVGVAVTQPPEALTQADRIVKDLTEISLFSNEGDGGR